MMWCATQLCSCSERSDRKWEILGDDQITLEVNIFTEIHFVCRDGPEKGRKEGKNENTRRLPYYGKTVEKKDKKTTLHYLLHI